MTPFEDRGTAPQWFLRSPQATGPVVHGEDRVPFARVVELVLDVREGRVAHAILAATASTDTTPGRLFVVPWGLLSPEESSRAFVLKSGPEHVLAGPSFDPNDRPDVTAPEWLEAIDRHYHDVKELPTLLTAAECEELIRCYEDHPDARAVHRDTTFVPSDVLPQRLLRRTHGVAELIARTRLSIELAQVVRWETGSEQRGHWDRARSTTLLTSVTNLNASYAGGRTFIGDDRRSITPVVGKTIFFDGQRCWHGVTPLTAGHRYTLAVWYRRQETSDSADEGLT